jgi:hypothetical protein
VPGLFLYDSCEATTINRSAIKRYSSWGLVDLLWHADTNELKDAVDPTVAKIPAVLILICCVLMPFLKLIATLLGVLFQSESILWTVARVAKFQHADGQIIMLLNSYLSLKPILDPHLLPGFYYFLAYCILSSASTQILLSQFVKKEEVAKHQSVHKLWFPIGFIQLVSVMIFFFYSPVMSVSPMDPYGHFTLARINKAMALILTDSSWFVACWLFTTVVVLPLMTYIAIPAVIDFGHPRLIQCLGGKDYLHLLMEYLHDWCLGDVMLLAYLITWFIVLSVKWTNVEAYEIGSFAMILFGIGSGFMIYMFRLNACAQKGGGSGEAYLSSGSEGATLSSTAPQGATNRSALDPAPFLEQETTDDRRRKGRSRVFCVLYMLIFGLYGCVAAAILHALQNTSKPTIDVSIMDELNQGLDASLKNRGRDSGILHFVDAKLGARLGSLGSCAKKGQEGGPPSSVPCTDVPVYNVGKVSAPLGLSFSEFTATRGGPIYEADVYEHAIQVAHLEVAFVTGLEGFHVDSLKFVDRGIYQNGNGSARRIQLQLELRTLNFQADKPNLSLPILVRMKDVPIIGKYETTPCCNPQRLTLTLNLNCQRHYPFFSLPPQNESVNVSIEPPDAVDINLFGLGNLSKFGIGREFIESKLARLVAQYVNTTINTTSVPGLGTFYPYPQLTLAHGLSFFIGSNLPISSSSEWEFCPESSA